MTMNACVMCGIEMGECNPRQYCGKTHCKDSRLGGCKKKYKDAHEIDLNSSQTGAPSDVSMKISIPVRRIDK